ncbi:SDR family oxidoreductase [Sinorhizobium meliloti]|uniref:3-oxoacyl-ACP reductase FabG n=1 Tax=Rhizobium meliloti TaxID=382 RepID=UPI000FD7DF9E|nr:3-oxoacyl-ACP reductase FabG [Sinorhizobium meliloti]MDX2330061.1 SDR family oxidoreductase [Sinorhizobium medicae]MDW9584114.1 SDR family oxidoreductase [Sinorhizobium meliloti]MDX0185543.1 SDR family oxidoreductase [Sinorhizobium meliloti]MDX0284478.1 SDR family oxidoreductase [Sinorhizobium meliloti]RVL23899.1 SDR family oxidoreductase [Sinorhizobium meliloti]
MKTGTLARVAVVTGGTTGIGLSCAEHLLIAGHRVAIFSTQAARVDKARDDLSRKFGAEKVIADAVDLRHPDALKAFFEQVERTWSSPEVLICNAGLSPKHNGQRLAFDIIPIDEWNDVLAINLTGAMLCCQLAAPKMAASGFGRIVLIGSIAGRAMPRLAGASYVASKAALAGMAKSLVSEYSSHGVTINIVAPGNVLTDMMAPPDSPAYQAALARIPSGRIGRPEDIAALVAFLASERAEFINGAIIDVNGGEYLPC